MPMSTFQDVDFEKANEKIKLGEEGTHASICCVVDQWIKILSPLDPSLVQERRVRMLAQIRRDSLHLRELSWRMLLERSNNPKNKKKKSKMWGEFLSNNNIIDYSLLLGIHEKDGKDGKIWEGE